MDQNFDNIWQFCVDDGYQSCEHMSEILWGSLCFHNWFCEKASTSYQVFTEQLEDDIMNVWYINFVDNSIDAFSEHFPHILLVLHRLLLLPFKVV